MWIVITTTEGRHTDDGQLVNNSALEPKAGSVALISNIWKQIKSNAMQTHLMDLTLHGINKQPLSCQFTIIPKCSCQIMIPVIGKCSKSNKMQTCISLNHVIFPHKNIIQVLHNNYLIMNYRQKVVKYIPLPMTYFKTARRWQKLISLSLKLVDYGKTPWCFHTLYNIY